MRCSFELELASQGGIYLLNMVNYRRLDQIMIPSHREHTGDGVRRHSLDGFVVDNKSTNVSHGLAVCRTWWRWRTLFGGGVVVDQDRPACESSHVFRPQKSP
jgi:hypothetical protein